MLFVQAFSRFFIVVTDFSSLDAVDENFSPQYTYIIWNDETSGSFRLEKAERLYAAFQYSRAVYYI